MPSFHPDTIQTIKHQLSLSGYDVEHPERITTEALHRVAVDMFDREFTSDEVAKVRGELARLVEGRRSLPQFIDSADSRQSYRVIADDRITTDMLDTLREVGVVQETIDRLKLEGSDLETLERRMWPGADTLRRREWINISFGKLFHLIESAADTRLTPVERLVIIVRFEEAYFNGQFDLWLFPSPASLKWDLALARDILAAKQSPQWKPPHMGLSPDSPGRRELDRTERIAKAVVGFVKK